MRNPFQIALLAGGGIAFVLAFMVWVVIGQVTDYLDFDVLFVAVLWGWTIALAIVGAVALAGAVAIAGVCWELRQARDRKPVGDAASVAAR